MENQNALKCLCLAVATAFLISNLSAQEPLPPPDVPAEPPVRFQLVLPDDITAATCDGNPIAVRFPTPRVISDCTNDSSVFCEPPSGTLFSLGQTTVVCWTTNACGEFATNAFTITVLRDSAPPVMACPSNIVAWAAGPDGVRVEYPSPFVLDDADPAPELVFSLPPGSLFPIGSTTVNCQAIDSCGNVATCSFTVEVRVPGMQVRRSSNPATGERTVDVMAHGFEAMDVTTDLNGEWTPLTNLSLVVTIVTNGFFRPPLIDGVLRAPHLFNEIAYVSVGLLAAYNNPGINPARISNDSSKDFGTKLLDGNDGGTANNIWSSVKNLPFTFHFFGRPYTQFRVSKNGLLTFSTNIVAGTEGLSYFNFQQSATSNVLANALPLWNLGYAVDNTIFGFAGRYVTQSASDDVYGYVHGSAPYRQVWIIFRHPKDLYGLTTTAIVLEETSNRILVMDMDTTTAGNNTSRLIVGIQGELNSTREVRQVPASPYIQLASTNGALADNGCFLFRPYALGLPVSGQASPQLMAATNLDLYITEQARLLNAPGLTVAISRNGRLIFNKAYGYANVEKNELMKPHHRACIGSVSKVLAAFGIEKLIDDGDISGLNSWAYASTRLGKQWFWDAVMQGVTNNIHTNFSNAVFLNTLSNTTIRHLLSHTAGQANRNDDPGAMAAYANNDYTQLLPRHHVQRFMSTQRLITNGVNLTARYSNPCFKQIGVLIEEASGQLFEPWMMNNVMIPGGAPFARLMRTYANEETWRDARRYHFYDRGSSSTTPPFSLANHPWAVSRITGLRVPPPYDDAIYNNAADGAAGSWTATAADLVRVLAGMDDIPNRPDFLPPARFNELETNVLAGSNQGIGWDSVTAARVWKNGNIGYGASHLVRSRGTERLTVAVVANTGANVTPLGNAVWDAVNAAIPGVTNISANYDLFPAQINFP